MSLSECVLIFLKSASVQNSLVNSKALGREPMKYRRWIEWNDTDCVINPYKEACASNTDDCSSTPQLFYGPYANCTFLCNALEATVGT